MGSYSNSINAPQGMGSYSNSINAPQGMGSYSNPINAPQGVGSYYPDPQAYGQFPGYSEQQPLQQV